MNPSLYQVNTRILLQELGVQLNRHATLDDVPDATLDQWAAMGFDWIWLLGVWQTGTMARDVSRGNEGWRREYREQLPDVKDEDITGSPFAIKEYSPHTDFGGRAALARLREKLKQRGLKLLLDFVPNHMAPDHAWRFAKPEYFVQGTPDDLLREPHNYIRLNTKNGQTVLAHGRDPYFPGWPDTLQLNYRHAGLRGAQTDTLLNIAEMCDGVRCDMAMLILPEVFARTWGERSWPADHSAPVDNSFWPEAVARVKQTHPGFVFMAEVYWDLEWELQQQGFDYTYDKRLYDRLRERVAEPIRKHFWAGLDFQTRSVRFLENHDEPRAADTFPPEVHRAASILAFLTPGLRFFHDGQLEGRKARVSMHLGRRRAEPVDAAIREHYRRLLEVLKRPEVRQGRWHLCEVRPAWDGNATSETFITLGWEGEQGRRMLIAVNYGPTQGQCRARPNFSDLHSHAFRLNDLMNDVFFDRDGDDMATNGLFIDLPGWGHHVFELQPR
jgi:glycosidase